MSVQVKSILPHGFTARPTAEGKSLFAAGASLTACGVAAEVKDLRQLRHARASTVLLPSTTLLRPRIASWSMLEASTFFNKDIHIHYSHIYLLDRQAA